MRWTTQLSKAASLQMYLGGGAPYRLVDGCLALVALTAVNLLFARAGSLRVVGAVSLGVLFGSVALLRFRWARISNGGKLALYVLAGLALSGVFLLLGLDPPIRGALALAVMLHSLLLPQRQAIPLCLALALPCTVVEQMAGLDLMPYDGVVIPTVATPTLFLVGLISAPILIVSAFALGILIRRRTLRDIDELAALGHEVAGREALLREAQLDLQRAAGVGDPGRFTGQTIGSFTLGPILGRGGMGEVYEAVHNETSEEAALKLLHTARGGSGELLDRFVREAEVLMQLQSPHIVRVLEVGDLSAPLPYIAMERLRGQTLSRILSTDGLGDAVAILRMLREVAAALEVARRSDIVHRDIKAANVFCTEEGTWKVLDFGIATLAGGSGTLTAGNAVGTPSCMSPEQITAAVSLDHRSDLYSLAVLAYGAITGQRPFARREIEQTLTAILQEMPVAPSELVDVPKAVDDVLRIAMAKNREHRFETAETFVKALEAAFDGTTQRAHAVRAARLNLVRPWRALGTPPGMTSERGS